MDIPPPDPRSILPPLVACLPTARLSARPPPVLLPLLSPILRQRINLRAGDKHGWLPLLSWQTDRADRLAAKVDTLDIEAHPVSGELELHNIDPIRYRRLDSETLQCRIDLPDQQLSAVYVWCQHDEPGPGWRLAELLAAGDETDISLPWSSDMSCHTPAEVQDTDDQYWAMYDNSSGQTPFVPSPNMTRGRSPPEDEYYQRYSEVQPALDPPTPPEVPAAAIQRHTSPSPDVRAERGVKSHITSQIKSLARLAQSVGMERAEFQRIVETELELLVMND